MSESIDQRVVQMKFDNAQFEKGIATSSQSLKNFSNLLNKQEGTKGLDTIAVGIEKVSALTVAKTALIGSTVKKMADKVVSDCTRVVKALTIEPVTTGLSEYELKMDSVQTIMAGTGESLDTVMDKLEELNTYSDRTIYKFSDMTENIGKFTNAGISLDVAVAAMKGLSNEAALAGANATEASRAMYNVSQAFSMGYMQYIDWKSIENANMATVSFKEELVAMAKELGTLDDAAIEAYGGLQACFKDGLKDGWLTNDVMLKTLAKYSDETTELGKKAYAAAQDIKTATQLFDTMGESVQSGWATTWENIIGNFDEAKELYTSIGQIFDFFVGKSADARNSVLSDWKKLGGRKDIIQGLYNIFANILMIIDPIKKGFRDVFPAVTGKNLADISKKFRELTNTVWLSRDAAEGLRKVTSALLTPFKLLGNALSVVAKGAGVLTIIVWGLVTAFLESVKDVKSLTSVVEDLFGKEDYERLTSSLVSIVESLGSGIMFLVNQIGNLGSAIKSIPAVSTFTSSLKSMLNIKKVLGAIVDAVEWLAEALKSLPEVDLSWENVVTNLGNAVQFLFGLLQNGVGIIQNLFAHVTSLFKPLTVHAAELENVDDGLVTINDDMTAMAGGIEEVLTPMDKLKKSFESSGGVIGNLSKALKTAKNAITTIGKAIKSSGVVDSILETIKNISPAKVLIIAFGLSLVSLVRTITDLSNALNKLFGSFGGIAYSIANMNNAIGGMFTQLKNTIKSLGDASRFNKISAGVRDLAIAISVLAISLGGLAIAFKYLNVEWKDIAKSAAAIGTVTVALMALVGIVAILVSAINAMGDTKKFVASAASLAGVLLSLAISVGIMASAFNKLSVSIGNSQEVESKLVTLGVMMGGLVTACIVMSKYAGKIETSAISILSMAVAMNLLARAFNKLADVDEISTTNALHFISITLASAAAFSALGKVKIKNALGMATFIASLLLLQKAVTILENLEVKNPEALIKNFVKVLFSLGVAFAAMNVVNHLTHGGSMASTGLGILAMASSLIAISQAIKIIAGIPSGNIEVAADVIKGMLGMYALIMALSMFSGQYAIRAGVAIQLMSIALLAIVGAIAIMTVIYDDFNPDIVRRAAICVGAMLGLFGIVSALTHFSGTAKAITSIVAGVGLLLTAVGLLSLLPTDKLIPAVAGVAVVLSTLGLVMVASSKINWKGALATIAPIAAITASLLATFILLKDVPVSEALEASGALAIVATSFAAAVTILSKANFGKISDIGKDILAFVLVAGSMIGIARLMSEFATEFMAIPFEALIGSTLSMGIMAITFANATAILSAAKFDKLSDVGKNIAAFAGVAVVMTGVAALLGKFAIEFMAIPFSQLISGATALSIMANAFAMATTILSAAQFDTLGDVGKNLLAFTGVAAGMSVAVNLMTPAFQKLAVLPWSGVLTAALAISALAVSMLVAAGILGMFSKMTGNIAQMASLAVGLIAMGAAIRIVIPSFKQLARLKLSQIAKGLIAMGGALVIMGATAGILGKFGAKAVVGAAAILVMAVAVKKLTPPLKQLGKMKLWDIIKAVIALAGAFVVLGAVGIILGSFAIQSIAGAAAMVILAEAVKILAPAFVELSKVDLWGLIKAVLALTSSFALLGAAAIILGTFGIQAIVGAGAMVILAAALNLLVPPFMQLASLKLADIGKALLALIVSFAGLGAISVVLGTFAVQAGIGAAVMVVLSSAVYILAAAFKVFSEGANILTPSLIRLQNVDLMGIAKGLGAIALAAAALGVGSALLVVGAVGVGAFAVALGILAVAIYALNEIISGNDILAKAFQAGIDLADSFINALSGKIGEVVSKGAELGNSFVDGLLNALVPGRFNDWTIIENDATAKAGSIGEAAGTAATDGFTTIIEDEGVAQASSVAEAQGKTYGTTLETTVVKNTEYAAEAGAEMFYGTLTKEGTKQAKSAAKEVGKATSTNLEKETVPKAEKSGTNTAKAYAKGFGNGIESDYDNFKKYGKNSAELVAEEMEEAGVEKMTIVGKTTSETFVDSVTDSLAKAMPELSDSIYAIGDKLKTTLGSVMGSVVGDLPIIEMIYRYLNGESVFSLMSEYAGGDTADTVSGLTDSLTDMTSGLDGVTSSSSSAASAAEDTTNAFSEMRDTIASSIDIFSEYSEVTKKSASEMMYNISSQLKGVSEWTNNLVRLGSMGFDEELLQELAEKGTDSAGEVLGLLDFSAEQVAAYNRAYERTKSIAIDSVEQIKTILPTLTEETAESEAKIREENAKTIDSINDIASSASDAASAMEETVSSTDKMADVIQQSIDAGESEAQMLERVQAALEETGDETDSVYKHTDQLTVLVQKAKTEGKSFTEVVNETQAALGKTADTTYETSEAAKTLYEAIQNGIDAGETEEETLKRLNEALNTNTGDMEENANAASNNASMIDNLFGSAENLIVLMQTAKIEHKTLQEVMDETNRKEAEAQEELNKTKAALLKIGVVMPDVSEMTVEMSDAFIFATAEMSKAAEDMQTTIKESIESSLNVFEEFSQSTELTGEKALSNLMSNINGYNEWKNMLVSLASDSNISDTLLQNLASQGIDSYEVVNAIFHSDESTRAQISASYEEAMRIPESVSESLMQGFKDTGMYTVAGFVAGISDNATQATSEIKRLADGSIMSMREALGIHSPSTVFAEIAKFTLLGFKNGAETNKPIAVNSIKAVSRGVVSESKSILTWKTFFDIGKNAVQGMIDGIKSKLSEVREVSAELGRASESSLRHALDEHSPSKITRGIGEYFGEGFAIGISSETSAVSHATENLSEDAINTLRQSIATCLELANSDIDTEPTIRPVFDMTNIQNGVADVRSLMSDSYNIGGTYSAASRAMGSYDSMMNNRAANTKFDNTNVVTAISQLREDVTNLTARISTLQVVMDTGTLVGELVNPMDAALGQKMAYNGRGV